VVNGLNVISDIGHGPFSRRDTGSPRPREGPGHAPVITILGHLDKTVNKLILNCPTDIANDIAILFWIL